MTKKGGWFRIKRGFFRKNMLFVKLDIKELYRLTNGTQTPNLEDVIPQFCSTLTHAIRRTHNRVEYREDQKIEKRSRKNMSGRF